MFTRYNIYFFVNFVYIDTHFESSTVPFRISAGQVEGHEVRFHAVPTLCTIIEPEILRSGASSHLTTDHRDNAVGSSICVRRTGSDDVCHEPCFAA